jgi:elongin-C
MSTELEVADQSYVTLVSSDGFEYVVLRDATLISPVIKGMLNPRSAFLEATTGRCVFQDIRYVVHDGAVRRSLCPFPT